MAMWKSVFAVTCLFAMLLAFGAFADSYILINNTGDELQVRSQAIAKPPTSPNAKQEDYTLAPGQTKKIDFGTPYRIFGLSLFPQNHMSETWIYTGDANTMNGPCQHYKVTMRKDFSVEKVTLKTEAETP